MRLSLAERILREQPLEFGNKDQIEAIRFIDRAECMAAHLANCYLCRKICLEARMKPFLGDVCENYSEPNFNIWRAAKALYARRLGWRLRSTRAV